MKGWKADWQKNNPEKTRAARLRFVESRPEYELERSRRRAANATAEDVQKKSASMAKWRKNNPDRNREIQKRSNRKLLSTPKGKLGSLIRNGINAEIKKGSKGGRKTFELLDYTLGELKDHLEKQFQPGMDWNNHGTGDGKWHIDHIIPLAAHNYETPDDIDFKQAWALANLRPLWANANISKGAKIDQPFQPALALNVSQINCCTD
ncbi:hypothetical protein [Brucella pituitosa]|uniref:HNH endonuclease n=1 Tax=Brucella pituitosa TaxID=571256 RepID=A0ABS3K0I0_9HYPH|nr:hypothetical protein [Brucella pituitosa]MBO1040438.1 hypothetical protein [Brucella pituitosa]